MIETEDYKAVYGCDGSTVRFDFTFQITEEADLDVKHYDDSLLTEVSLILGTDYTMEQATLGTWLDGGTVVAAATYPSDDRISLTRDVSSTQTLDYVENDPFPAESHEGGLDKLTIIAQQLEELLSRAMLIPKSDPADLDLELGSKEARLNKYIKFDATTGEPGLVENIDTAVSSTTAWSLLWLLKANAQEAQEFLGIVEAGQQVSAFIKTLMNDSDAAEARDTLGVNGPAFSVNLGGSNQDNIVSIDLIEWSTEIFDTAGDFTTGASARFTPSVEGKYLLSVMLSLSGATLDDLINVYIYKNGSVVHKNFAKVYEDGGVSYIGCTAIVDANGTTDYFEIYSQNQQRDTMDVVGTEANTYWTGSRIG